MLKFKRFFLIEQYLFSIKARLCVPRKQKREIIKDYRDIIYNAIEAGNETINCKQDLYNLFETVDTVVRTHMSLQDAEETKEYGDECLRNKIMTALYGIFSFLTIIYLIRLLIKKSHINLTRN